MDEYIVYMHTVPNGKKYIGITQQVPEKRWHNGIGYKDNVLFWKDIIKYGWNNVLHEILFTGLSELEALQKESELILKFKTNDSDFGYNVMINKCDPVKQEKDKLPTNTNLLKARMVENGDIDCVNCLVELLDVSRTTASNKLNGKADFVQSEIALIAAKYGLSDEDIRKIFVKDERE